MLGLEGFERCDRQSIIGQDPSQAISGSEGIGEGGGKRWLLNVYGGLLEGLPRLRLEWLLWMELEVPLACSRPGRC
jgi:hypothetical protein